MAMLGNLGSGFITGRFDGGFGGLGGPFLDELSRLDRAGF